MAAYAYFTATGSGNGSAGVGTSTNFTVGNFSSTGSLYPGDATGAAVSYRITNPSTGHQAVRTVTVGVASGTDSGGNTVVLDSTTGNPVTGCLATWFSAGSSSFKASDGTTTVTLTADVAGSDYITGTTTVLMSNVGSSQDACKNASPRISVTVG